MEARLTARVVESLRRMESGCQTDLLHGTIHTFHLKERPEDCIVHVAHTFLCRDFTHF